MMGKTIIDVYSMYVSPIPAKNDWMLLVQRMFSYLKQGWTVMKWNIKLCEQLQTSYLAHRTAFQSFLDSCKCLLQRLKPMQICKGVTKHRLLCMMMVSSSSIFEIIWVYAKMLGIPKRIRTKKRQPKRCVEISGSQSLKHQTSPNPFLRPFCRLTDRIGISSGREQGFGNKGKTWTEKLPGLVILLMDEILHRLVCIKPCK